MLICKKGDNRRLFYLLLSVILFVPACATQKNIYTPGELKALAAKDTALLTEEQGFQLDAFWFKNSTGIFQQCRSRYPEDKKNILLIIQSDLSGKPSNVWVLEGGQVGACLAQDIRDQTMPQPPFEPFFSPLYAAP